MYRKYIEIKQENKHLIHEGRYERKQTLTNAERYVTQELKEREKLILEANEESVDLEHELFLQIRDTLKNNIEQVQSLARALRSEERRVGKECRDGWWRNGRIETRDG